MFALVPSFAAQANSTPTFVNVTSTLDSQLAGSFLHHGTPGTNTTSYETSVPIFAKTGLPEGPHTLKMNVGPDSVFLLDYIVYTEQDGTASTAPNAGTSDSLTTSGQSPTGSSSASITLPSAALSQCV